jgi:hypothetical protein
MRIADPTTFPEGMSLGESHLSSKPQFNTGKFPQPDDHGYDYWLATLPTKPEPSCINKSPKRVERISAEREEQ